jgi:predicted fused transcriptional regulator/phosphomethylpyrimidine kinase
MEAALKVIQQTEGFGLVMPQVRANLVACDTGATSEADIAGVPGRITLVEGYAAAYGGPQFGASRHTARILLWAKGLWPDTRSCLCISGREEIVNATEDQGFTVHKMKEPASNAEAIAESATQMVKSLKKKVALPALHVPGGIGVEPILYLFDKSALTLATRCSSICETVRGASASRAP